MNTSSPFRPKFTTDKANTLLWLFDKIRYDDLLEGYAEPADLVAVRELDEWFRKAFQRYLAYRTIDAQSQARE